MGVIKIDELVGIKIDKLPYRLTAFKGVLLFQEYPTTIILEDTEGYPIVKEWVDCSMDNSIDRYFYYKTSKVLLKKLIDGELTHRELINQAKDGYVIFEDLNTNGSGILSNAPVKLIQEDYMPMPDFYFKVKDGVETNKIIKHFSLNAFK